MVSASQCQCFYIASEFNARVVFLMFCFSAVCFFINESFSLSSSCSFIGGCQTQPTRSSGRAVVSALWASLSSRHSSALYCFYCIVSVLMNKIFIHSFIHSFVVWTMMRCCRITDGCVHWHMYRNRIRACHVVRSFHISANVSILMSPFYSKASRSPAAVHSSGVYRPAGHETSHGLQDALLTMVGIWKY